jgi:hypothetical protein
MYFPPLPSSGDRKRDRDRDRDCFFSVDRDRDRDPKKKIGHNTENNSPVRKVRRENDSVSPSEFNPTLNSTQSRARHLTNEDDETFVTFYF